MKTPPTFPEFENRLRELLLEEEYLQIINLIEDEGDIFPNEHAYLVYWQVGMAARDNNPDLAIQYLDGLLEEGIWISQFLLRNSPSFENLQDSLDFDERVEAMAILQRREAAQLLPLLAIRQDEDRPLDGEPYPLMLGLHRDRGTALGSLKLWQPAAKEGWLVGAPQSKQALWSGAYVWDDFAQAREELVEHVRELATKYPIDVRRIILAGHQQGGELAAWLPCSGGMDVRGFIAIAPMGNQVANPDRWFRALQASEPKGLRGVIITGDVGMPYIPELKRMTEILNAFEVPTLLQILPGVGIVDSPEYHEPIAQAIDFILT